MNVEHVKHLLEQLGASKINISGNKVKSPCPLAPWRHSKYKDSHPSFVVFASDIEESICKCMACGFKGSLARLIWALESESNSKLDVLHTLIQKHDKVDLSAALDKIDLGIFSKRKPIPVLQGGVPAEDFIKIIDNLPNRSEHEHFVNEMHQFLKTTNKALEYIYKDRKLTDIDIDKWKLGYHPGARRIAIPQYDKNKKLINIGGRYVSSMNDDPFWTPPPWMHAKGFEKEHYLFGEDFLDITSGNITLVLVEGMFDVIYLSKKIPNMVAMLGAHLSRWQIMKIRRWASRLVIVPDGDPPGYEAADRINTALGKQVDVKIYPTPIGKDPDQLDDSAIDKILDLIV